MAFRVSSLQMCRKENFLETRRTLLEISVICQAGSQVKPHGTNYLMPSLRAN